MGGAYAYLTSVASEENDPQNFQRSQSMSLVDFARELGLKNLKTALQDDDLVVLERTVAGRIASLSVAGQVLKGTDFRKALGLASTDIEWQISDGQIHLTTYGSGHGVGMSQYGALSLAEEGRVYKAILAHYYAGASLEQSSSLK